ASRAMKGAFLLILLLLTGCERQTAPASLSTEPFHIKTNDTVGIKLGMPWSDYIDYKKHGPRSQDCHKEGENDKTRVCTISAPEELMVGDTDVSGYSLTFFDGRLIDIYYLVTSLEWEHLIDGLKDKFGLPTSYSRDVQCVWQNAVSSIWLAMGSGNAGTLD